MEAEQIELIQRALDDLWHVLLSLIWKLFGWCLSLSTIAKLLSSEGRDE